MSQVNALQLLRSVDKTGHLIVRGTSSLMLLRDAIRLAVRQAGVTVKFDPSSDPSLVDYLSIAGLSTLERATGGALLGLLIGGLFGRPAAGLVVGAGFGATSGLAKGVDLVRKGWRISALREVDGTPLLQIAAA